MIRRALAWLALLLAGCAPPRSARVDLEVVNRTGRAIVIHARTGPITRTIALEPDDSFDGYIVNPGAGRVHIELRPPGP